MEPRQKQHMGKADGTVIGTAPAETQKPALPWERFSRDAHAYRLLRSLSISRKTKALRERAALVADVLRRQMRVNYLQGVYGEERQRRALVFVSIRSLVGGP